MEQETYNSLSFIFQTIFSLAITVFTLLQLQINRRLKKLGDYVAISVTPILIDNTYCLQIKNVGKLQVYLHKYEVGESNVTFEKDRLLSCAPDFFYYQPVPNIFNIEMPVKLYLVDEFGEKYIFTGATIIDQISLPNQNITPPQNPSKLFMRAWSYKTEKHNWSL